MVDTFMLILFTIFMGILISVWLYWSQRSYPASRKVLPTKNELKDIWLDKYKVDSTKKSSPESNFEVEVARTETNDILARDEPQKNPISNIESSEIVDRGTKYKDLKNEVQVRKTLENSISRGLDKDTLTPITNPIKSLDDLLNWMPGFDEFSIARVHIRKTHKDSNNRPKTLVCHDMKGGYIEDRFVQGFNGTNCYNINHWNLIDTFVYFSHNFITIPPPCWTNVCHTHGVKVLGTLITEWTDGAELCSKLLQDEFTVRRVVDHLVQLTHYYRFDGWLINIENEIQPSQVDQLVFFVKHLTEQMHSKIPHSEVIWYDSVIYTGQLKWQNKLCRENRMFFDACDGIFLNYTWSVLDLQHSTYISGGNRQHDIYVGLDVFGRGCFGGGGYNSYKAMQVIRDQNLSAAIFAPGWVMETQGEENFPANQERFWELLTSYLYPHCIASLPLVSSFSRGQGNHAFINGKKFSLTSWTNLSEQSLQPSFSSSFYQFGAKENMKIEQVVHCTTHAYDGGGCWEVQGELCADEKPIRTAFRLFRTHISIEDDLLVSFTYMSSSEHLDVNLLLLFDKKPQYWTLISRQDEHVSNDAHHYSECLHEAKKQLSEDQEGNYEFFAPLSQPFHDDITKIVTGDERSSHYWKTRNFILNKEIVNGKLLQEIRLVVERNQIESVKMEASEKFSVKVGEVRLMKERDVRIQPSSAKYVRARDVHFVDSIDDASMSELSLTLTWDYEVTPSACKPIYYNIYCRGNFENPAVRKGSSTQAIETSLLNESGALADPQEQNSLEFIGQAYADSFRVGKFRVPATCDHNGLEFTIQSVSRNRVKQSLNDSSTFIVKW